MKPYYRDEWVSIFHGDSREVMSGVGGEVLVTDPPYGVDWNAAGGGIRSTSRERRGKAFTTIAGDSEPFDPTWLLAAALPTGVVVGAKQDGTAGAGHSGSKSRSDGVRSLHNAVHRKSWDCWHDLYYPSSPDPFVCFCDSGSSGGDGVSGLVTSFDTDDGRLDGIAPELAFVLGVEFQMVRGFVVAGEEIHTRPVHTDNYRRIQSLLARHGYHQEWEHRDDWSFVTASLEAPG